MGIINKDQIQSDYREKRRKELRDLASSMMGPIFVEEIQKGKTVDEAFDTAVDLAITGANALISRT